MLALQEKTNDRVFYCDVSTRVWVPGAHISREGDKYGLRQRKPCEVKCANGDDSG